MSSGEQLVHSPYLRLLIKLALTLRLDQVLYEPMPQSRFGTPRERRADDQTEVCTNFIIFLYANFYKKCIKKTVTLQHS